MRGVCVAGIGTGVGKTVVAASICACFGADYWKPIQSGVAVESGDSAVVAQLLAESNSCVHPPAYSFNQPLSPHVAAQLDGKVVDCASLTLPSTEHPLVVELAGGIMVPLNGSATNLDLIIAWGLPVVLVSRHYLGSINHTLLSIAALRQAQVSIAGIVFNGEELPETEPIIQQHSGVRVFARMPEVSDWTPRGFAAASRELWAHVGDLFGSPLVPKIHELKIEVA
jgi:dethiobiotin synthetase